MPERKSTKKTARAPRKAARARKKSDRTLTVVQFHSGIGCPERQRRVLRSLGLKGPHDRRSLPDLPSIRGMVAALPHLVRIEEPAASARAGRRRA